MELPEKFRQEMTQLLGEEEFAKYEACFLEERTYSLRLNTYKLHTKEQQQDVLRKAGLKAEPVAWIPNGYYYDSESEPAKHPYYYAGLYYLQEASAMTPASLLPIHPGDSVLDICAAPGGKSTELASKLCGRGMLLANDISNSRAKALLKNLEMQGFPNIYVTSEASGKLKDRFTSYFDKILVDAPCSGEGMFRKDAGMIKSWLEKGPEYYVPIQRNILKDAVSMLKPGGMLLYSTCTFSVKENEENITWLLETCPQMKLVRPDNMYEGFAKGSGLPDCIRLFPYMLKGEGHFIALLQKQSASAQLNRQELNVENKQTIRHLEQTDFFTFFKQIRKEFDKKHLFVHEDAVYYAELPADMRKGIRFLRTGLLLGTLKKNRFEPSQALAMSLKEEEFEKSISFSYDDIRVMKYLKGETIFCPECDKDGWYLICVDHYPLGFGKCSRQTMKNKYYAGWRIQ